MLADKERLITAVAKMVYEANERTYKPWSSLCETSRKGSINRAKRIIEDWERQGILQNQVTQLTA